MAVVAIPAAVVPSLAALAADPQSQPTAEPVLDCNGNGIPDASDTSALAFRSARSSSFGPTQHAIVAVAADIDSDGDVDVVTANPLAVVLNPGNGRFGSAVTIDNALVDSLAAADLDGDGDTDIVTGNNESPVVRIFYNSGGGTFASPVEVAAPFAARLLTTADMDGDGDADVVIAGIDHLAVLFNGGVTGFTAGPVLNTPFVYPERLFTVDFDGDRDLDVFLGDTSVVLAVNTGRGQLEAPRPVWEEGRGPAYASGDLDGDGQADLVAGDSFFRYVRIGLNDSGTVTTAQELPFARDIRGLLVEDRDGDGDLDVVALAGGQLFFLRNVGAGQFEVGDSAVVLWGDVIVSADFNADETRDVAVFTTRGQMAVVLGAPGGGFVAPLAAPTGSDPQSLALIDVDKDEHLDVVVANYSSATVSIMRNVDGLLSAPEEVAAGTNPSGVAGGDLDGDDDIDLVVGHTDTGFPTRIDTVSILSNSGGGHFSKTTDLIAGSAPFEVHVADLNGDTRPDIIAGGVFHYVAVFLNEEGGYAPRREVPIADGTSGSIDVGDIDGDGDLDLVVANGPYSSAITILRNRGDATFDTSQIPIELGEPVQVALADLEPDGDLDIVVQTFYGRIIVLINAGPSGFAEPVVNDLTVQGGSLAIGDLDGDGDPDLAVATSDGLLALLRNSGGGVFTANDFLAAGASPRAVALGNVIGDGAVNIVSTETDSSQVLISANLTPRSTSEDCDADQIPDECQVAENDCDRNGVPDNCQGDTDHDTVPNGCDACPGRDDRPDADSDLVPDCLDGCPFDPLKHEPGPCGCGVPETDENENGIPECSGVCPCDCNGDHEVSVDELIQAVNIALARFPIFGCRAADYEVDGGVTIAELISGVRRALMGCDQR